METIRYLDAQLDLVAEGIDLALRMGDMTSSTLRSRRLGSIGRKLVCAPSYLNSLPRIKKPEDLSHAEFVAMQGLTDQLTMVNGRETYTLSTGRGRVLVDNFFALRAALRAGIGIQRLPTLVAEPDLKSGHLIEVLPRWSLPDLGIYGVWPDTSRRSSLTRLLVEHIDRTT